MRSKLSIGRRQLLGALGGSAAMVAGCGSRPPREPEQPAPESLDLRAAQARVKTFVKASSRVTAGRTIWATRAEVHAVLPNGRVIPMVRVKGCEQQWIRPLSDGEYLSFDSLVTYYCDFTSDAVIDEFHNPLTGALNTVRPLVSRMAEGREISSRGVVYRIMRQAYPEFYSDQEFDVLIREVGGTVSFQGEFRWPPEFIRAPAGSKLTFFTSRAALADPRLESAPANFAGYVLMPYFPWMDMADHPGHLLWNVQGYKVDSVAELSDDYLAAARAELGYRFEQSPEFDTEPSGFARRLRAMGKLR